MEMGEYSDGCSFVDIVAEEFALPEETGTDVNLVTGDGTVYEDYSDGLA